MILKVFTKEDGPGTEEALDLAKEMEENDFQVEYYDFDQPETYKLAEIFEIFSVPSFVVTQADGREVSAWRGEIPSIDEIKNFMSQ